MYIVRVTFHIIEIPIQCSHMNPGNKKSKLTVKYEPLGSEGVFDVKLPDQKCWSDVEKKAMNKNSDFWRFFAMAFVIFLIFTGISAYINGSSLFQKNKNIAFAGYDSLKSGINLLAKQDTNNSGAKFQKAQNSFESLSKNFRYLTNQSNNYLRTNLYLDAAQKLIASGIEVSKIGKELSGLLVDVKKIPQTFIESNGRSNGGSNGRSNGRNLIGLVNNQKKRLDRIMDSALITQNNLTTLNTKALPADLRGSIATAQDQIGTFLAALLEIDKNFGTALKLFGDKVPHRYLILLQNNNELRATGGFIGSYMLVDVNDGVITKFDTKDVYESDGQLTEIITPPPGIDQVSKRYYMRDANYSPDFSVSAKKIMWFLEHSGGPSVDTVIAIDQTVAVKFLELIGPIQFADLPIEVTSKNFTDIFSFHAESKLSTASTPKQLLIDFIPVFKKKLLGLKDFSQVNDVVQNLIEGRHIQAYSTDAGIQAVAEKFRADGKMVTASDNVDFLSVVTTSVGGNKSDAFVKTDLNHKTQIDSTGTIIDSLSIKKTHTWNEDSFKYWTRLIKYYGPYSFDKTLLRFIQGEGDNVDYMRVYTPKGSELIGLQGVNIEDLKTYEDLGYTVFAFTFGPVTAGGNKTVDLTYKLPFNLKIENPLDTYKFITQKQAGSDNVTLQKTLKTSDYLKVFKSYPQKTTTLATNLATTRIYKTALDKNKIFLSAIGVN